MSAPVIVAIMRRRERDVVDDFRAADATTAANAKSLADIGIAESRAVRRLSRREVLREASPGMLYLDEAVWAANRAARRRMAIVMVVSIALVGVGLLYGFLTIR
ncbi:MAG TPA: hypothetical protein VM939_06475 [Gemmatimonadaceae bacterium]|nr:hypothetical protein [Gemmatimonadaceae bacterium]